MALSICYRDNYTLTKEKLRRKSESWAQNQLLSLKNRSQGKVNTRDVTSVPYTKFEHWVNSLLSYALDVWVKNVQTNRQTNKQTDRQTQTSCPCQPAISRLQINLTGWCSLGSSRVTVLYHCFLKVITVLALRQKKWNAIYHPRGFTTSLQPLGLHHCFTVLDCYIT